ncbi:MAG: MFS family permease [Oleiphilaceae bacterium]|jgi:MFS family permease
MMTKSERRSVFSLALLYATRMLGLFMVLPVFMIYGQDLENSSSLLLGVAIGAYGLSQALFQIPFGALSDKYGRKPLIFFGLVLFFLGSLLAAVSTDIYGVILGRFLQGAGAIASVLMALLSDLTSEESRTKGMALIGMSIGMSFSVALVIGPLVAGVYGLQGIFWLTAFLALFGIFWLIFFVPSPVQSQSNRNVRLFKDQIGEVLRNKELLRLDGGIFALHLCLTAVFIAVPISLQNHLEMPGSDHWLVYLTVIFTSFFAMVPFIIIGEKKNKMKGVFLFAILLLCIASFSFSWSQYSFIYFWFSLFLFFMAFNLLEASLPSLVSKISPAGNKGTAMGIYSTSQFFGAFVGGVLGGFVVSNFQEAGVYYLVSGVCFFWFLGARNMEKPNSETGISLTMTGMDHAKAQLISDELSLVAGVEEVVLIARDEIAYLKVVTKQLNRAGLTQIQRQYSNVTTA